MMQPSHLAVAFIIPTSMYVKTSVNTAERCCKVSLPGENCQLPETVTRPPATKCPKAGRLGAVMEAGVHTGKAGGPHNRAAIGDLPLVSGLVPDVATRGGR